MAESAAERRPREGFARAPVCLSAGGPRTCHCSERA